MADIPSSDASNRPEPPKPRDDGPSGSSKTANRHKPEGTLHECNRYMLENGAQCDVILKVKNKSDPKDPEDAAAQYTTLPAHKYVLHSRCPTLARLVEEQEKGVKAGDGQATSDGKQGVVEVEIDDVTPAAMQQILRYLYYEKEEFTYSTAFDVLIASRRYNLNNFESDVFSFINEHITVQTVCPILQRSLQINDRKLINTCMDLISRKTQAVLSDSSFLRSNERVVDLITSMDYLSIQEIELFQRSVQWARSRPSARPAGGASRDELVGPELRRALGSLITNKRIRFPTMSIDQFRREVIPLAILDSNEANDVYGYLTYTGQDKPETMFKEMPRRRPRGGDGGQGGRGGLENHSRQMRRVEGGQQGADLGDKASVGESTPRATPGIQRL